MEVLDPGMVGKCSWGLRGGLRGSPSLRHYYTCLCLLPTTQPRVCVSLSLPLASLLSGYPYPGLFLCQQRRWHLILLCCPGAALGRGACSHLLVLSRHRRERATAIIPNQLEQPGPGLTITGEALWKPLLFHFIGEDTEAREVNLPKVTEPVFEPR